ncbi:hypothetical protein ACI3PL_22445, partial [Lacticaseibacillus paracasei]
DENVHIVGIAISYDMAVIARAYPKLIPAIWEAYESLRIHDIAIMEKLRHISTYGDLEFMSGADGMRIKRVFDLNELTRIYLHKDRSHEK